MPFVRVLLIVVGWVAALLVGTLLLFTVSLLNVSHHTIGP